MATKSDFTVHVHFVVPLCTDSGVCVCAEVLIAKAMYNYAATINKEFDFKAEDIITVMDMPLDGW